MYYGDGGFLIIAIVAVSAESDRTATSASPRSRSTRRCANATGIDRCAGGRPHSGQEWAIQRGSRASGRGTLTDHYDPRSKTLRLSSGVYDAPSVAAVGIAAHEAGHALQDKTRYPALASALGHGAHGAVRQQAGTDHLHHRHAHRPDAAGLAGSDPVRRRRRLLGGHAARGVQRQRPRQATVRGRGHSRPRRRWTA